MPEMFDKEQKKAIKKWAKEHLMLLAEQYNKTTKNDEELEKILDKIRVPFSIFYKLNDDPELDAKIRKSFHGN